ncbi:hypothetical protein CDO73_04775 [Saccharibacillus sp. O23]|nr:hypothetical protein CDO73_04775 [Saccharibacillus sp. O23]
MPESGSRETNADAAFSFRSSNPASPQARAGEEPRADAADSASRGPDRAAECRARAASGRSGGLSAAESGRGLTARGLVVDYGGGPVLGPLDLDLQEHGIYTVLGPSGSGKSTLLRTAAGLTPRFRGSLAYGGRPIGGRGAAGAGVRVGFVPQNYGLLPWHTALANVKNALKIARPEESRAERDESARRWLARMGLAGLEGRYPRALSGGQQQRVAIARAFAVRPDLLLLDEPFSALDAVTREGLQNLLLDNWRQQPSTTLFVTHDVEEAVLLGRQIVMLTGGSGSFSAEAERADRSGGAPFFPNEDVRERESQDEFPASASGIRLIDNAVVFSLADSDKRDSEAFREQTRRVRRLLREGR